MSFLTLNQNQEILENFSLKHKGINDFYYGERNEGEKKTPITYPYMEAILQGSELKNGLVTRKYLIIISDLVNKDLSNRELVSSDCERICFDLVNYLRGIANSGLLGVFKVNQDVNLTDFTDGTDDEVTGHFFELSISSHLGNEGCNLPINSGNILSGNYIYIGNTSFAGNFKVDIKDQDGTIIQTFNTSGSYVVNVLTSIQQVIGNTTPVIIQNII